MAAAIAGATRDQRLRGRDGILREPWQGVELAHDRDHRLAASPGGDEGRRNLRDAGLDREARSPELLLQEGAALHLLIADLREAPDLFRDAGVCGGPGVERLQD
jgi:hypothetical protein